MKKQISLRLDEKLLAELKAKLSKESKSLTLFLINVIRDYVAKKP